jgi:hypothetical protein
MASHYLELTDAQTIVTSGFALTQRAVHDCVEMNAIGAVYGGAGVGKTFAVEHASSTAGLKTHRLTFPKQPAITHLTKTMLRELTGIEHHAERFKLTTDLLAVLSEEPRLLVVDEAQQLNADAFDYLRFLHDSPSTRFALLFVGGHGCWRTLSRHRMLLSRIFRSVAVQSLSEDEVVELLPRFHPVHAGASIENLLWVNDEFAQGNFRCWSAFTQTVATLCASHRVATYTHELAQAALALLPSWQANVA